MKFEVRGTNNEIRFQLSLKTYTKEALYGAALVFTDQTYAFLDASRPGNLTVVLRGKKPLDGNGLERLAGEFHNELLNQTLRWMVTKHNKKTRDAITLQALYAAQPGLAVKRKSRAKT